MITETTDGFGEAESTGLLYPGPLVEPRGCTAQMPEWVWLCECLSTRIRDWGVELISLSPRSTEKTQGTRDYPAMSYVDGRLSTR